MNEMIGRGNMNAASATEETKKIAEVQGKMILAMKFPRNVDASMQMIEYECQNEDLAEKAIYEFPRGDSVVRGASIRLVECVARHWGNIVSGVEELAGDKDGATVRAYCWDLQTNFSDEKIFDVSYMRVTKKGSYPLTDPRDRYEKMANEAARRKRACIQAIIPKFVIDRAMELCQQTLDNQIKKDDINETKAKMLAAFRSFGDWITEWELSEVCGKDWEHLGSRDIVKLRNLYNAIKDGFIRPEVAFNKDIPEKPAQEETKALDKLNDMIAGATSETQKHEVNNEADEG
ncbi:MAG: hypothetical protein IJW55_07395 [Clostridia bacterium]|nr:hypothetical protein [Clostridia bacterium]